MKYQYEYTKTRLHTYTLLLNHILYVCLLYEKCGAWAHVILFWETMCGAYHIRLVLTSNGRCSNDGIGGRCCSFSALMMIDAIKRVPPDFVGLGRTLGLSDRKILLRIVIPSALPAIWDALRISLGWAWTWLVLAELVASTSGLGYRIVVSQRYFQTDTIIGYILLLGLLGLITDQIMRAAERVLFRYNRRRS